jgi:hypothetical protein
VSKNTHDNTHTQLFYLMTLKYVSFLRAEGLLGQKNFAQIAPTLKQNVMAFMRKTNNLHLAHYLQSVIVLLTPDGNLQCHTFLYIWPTPQWAVDIMMPQ